MGNARAFTARAGDWFGARCRAAVGSTRRMFRSAECSIQDHATPILAGLWVLMIGSIITLLLWKTAKVISLAGDFQPVLTVISLLTGAILGLLRVLKRRRNARLAATAELADTATMKPSEAGPPARDAEGWVAEPPGEIPSEGEQTRNERG